jgi:hypothetical protein
MSTDLGTLSLHLTVKDKDGKAMVSSEKIEGFSDGATVGWSPKDLSSSGGVSVHSLQVTRTTLPSTAELLNLMLKESSLTVELVGTQHTAGADKNLTPGEVFKIVGKNAKLIGFNLSGGDQSKISESLTFDAIEWMWEIGPTKSKKIANWNNSPAKKT